MRFLPVLILVITGHKQPVCDIEVDYSVELNEMAETKVFKNYLVHPASPGSIDISKLYG